MEAATIIEPTATAIVLMESSFDEHDLKHRRRGGGRLFDNEQPMESSMANVFGPAE